MHHFLPQRRDFLAAPRSLLLPLQNLSLSLLLITDVIGESAENDSSFRLLAEEKSTHTIRLLLQTHSLPLSLPSLYREREFFCAKICPSRLAIRPGRAGQPPARAAPDGIFARRNRASAKAHRRPLAFIAKSRGRPATRQLSSGATFYHRHNE